MNGTLYFSAKGSADAGKTLWVLEDGASGPVSVIGEPGGEALLYPEVGVAYKGCLYVSAFSEGAGRELWRVTGNVGTLLEINEGGASSYPEGFAVYDERLFFRAAREEQGAELWVVDGEEALPFLFKEIAPGKEFSAPGELTVSGETLFFAARTRIMAGSSGKATGPRKGQSGLKTFGAEPLEVNPDI